MSCRLLSLLALVASLLPSCRKELIDRIPPSLSGHTWDLSSRTVVKSDASGTTTTTTPIASGAFSVRYLGNGTYNLTTGGAAATGNYTYDGQTITFQNAVGASQTRLMTVTSLTDTQLVTVEKTQDATSQYTSTDTYKAL